MASLGAMICQAIVHHYGRDEFLRRLSHPFWFQSFGAVDGDGLAFVRHRRRCDRLARDRGSGAPGKVNSESLCSGGRGKRSRRTPDELRGCSATETGLAR